MTAFAPTSFAVVLQIGLLLAATLLAGLAVSRLGARRGARAAAWALVVAATVAAERLAAREPAGVRMLALIAALLYAMKAVVSVEWTAISGATLSPLRWLAFAAAWPGMRPALFTSLGGPPPPGGARLVLRGLVVFAAGVGLVALAAAVARRTGSRVLATALLLPGLSLALHFGMFAVLAGLWRRAGAECAPLFRAPLRSRSLREFWARRWNLAFSEMTAVAVQRPLSGALGPTAALLAAFAFSGLLHELAISLPVRAGFGGPLAYFLLHGVLAVVERRLESAGRPIDRHALLGPLWTVAWLALPLPLLFHAPFLRGVLWPLLAASSAVLG